MSNRLRAELEKLSSDELFARLIEAVTRREHDDPGLYDTEYNRRLINTIQAILRKRDREWPRFTKERARERAESEPMIPLVRTDVMAEAGLYRCPTCGQFFPEGTPHYCTGKLTNQPLSHYEKHTKR